MTVGKLPSGKWRARVWDPAQSKDVPVAMILGEEFRSFDTKRDAKAAEAKAREAMLGVASLELTVEDFWKRWITEVRFKRPKESTNFIYRDRTKAFVKMFARTPLASIGRRDAARWLLGGNREYQVPALRAMWSDAVGLELTSRNPWAGLRLAATRGNRDVDPPAEETVWALIAAAREASGPHFAAWLQVAAFTGMRPAELDALRWENVDFEHGRIRVVEQWSEAAKDFTLPKNGRKRDAVLTPPAREALLAHERCSEFVFVNLWGQHWRQPSRAHHWKRTVAKVDYSGTLYLATRHHAGSYMTNRLLLPAEDVAIALGHTDGGQLVRTLYGHRSQHEALDRVMAAYEGAGGTVRHLRAVGE